LSTTVILCLSLINKARIFPVCLLKNSFA